MRAGRRRQSSRGVPGQEERALPATGGARKRGALEEERALPATGGARKRGALEDERALPAGGARKRGAANAPRGCGGRAQRAPRSDDARGLRLAPAPARLPRPADGTAPASLGPAARDARLQRHGSGARGRTRDPGGGEFRAGLADPARSMALRRDRPPRIAGDAAGGIAQPGGAGAPLARLVLGGLGPLGPPRSTLRGAPRPARPGSAAPRPPRTAVALHGAGPARPPGPFPARLDGVRGPARGSFRG